jgi:hypothetical protein
MSGDRDEESPLLDSFEEVFPPTPLPNTDVFDKIEQNQPVITSALAGLLLSCPHLNGKGCCSYLWC